LNSIKQQTYINLEETITNAEISINKQNLSAITKNENINTLIYNHYALFGIISGIFVIMFALFIKEGFKNE